MNVQDNKESRTTQFLVGSFLMLLILSAAAFFCLGFYMSNVSQKSIDQVGDMYMAGISEQIYSHFSTLIELKLEQIETAEKVVGSNVDNVEALYNELIYRVEVRGFDYLALCDEDGRMEMLYGERIELADPDPFFASLKNREQKVAIGKDKSGREVVLFGISADYPMRNGERSMAMITAVSVDYISSMLATEEESELMYSYIIRNDGSYVVNPVGDAYTSYFESLYGRFGGSSNDMIDTYIQELTDAMIKSEEYSTILEFDGNRRQIYCVKLPYSEWNLVTVLPFGAMNEVIEEMNQSRTMATMLIGALIGFVMLFIFYCYYKMTKQHIKELNEARVEALQATKAKSEFLSNMSHDIRTPMNAIVGMTAIATAHIDDKKQVQNCLRKIALSGKHLLGLINDVLDMSKIESGKMTLTAELISLQEVVEGIVSIAQTQIKAKGQNFNVHIDKIIAEDVYCDSVRLNQVLLNLLSNAIKYTQEGGTIQLSMYQEDTPEKDGSYVRTHVFVKDNGIGMTAEFLEHIFDSYSRADSKRVQKTQGTGLGMTITKYIVDAMGGTLTVESAPEKGTEFHLVLDLEKATEQEINMFLPPWKMLVVDDDETLCRTAVESLESIGLQADWTLSGEKAIEMVTRHHKMHDEYQIVLLDWKLPDMDGIAVAKRLRRIISEEMPLILISAYDWSEFEVEAREAGINGFISKPLFKSTLYHELKKYMGVDDAMNKIDKDIELTGRHVLVAEDNDLNWEILKELLTDIGMELELSR
ncbi:MAG: response regulator, partial [Lachnospiraceae bacterium]|nr:response regulator [Lachnospiraceae bacterium]